MLNKISNHRKSYENLLISSADNVFREPPRKQNDRYREISRLAQCP